MYVYFSACRVDRHAQPVFLTAVIRGAPDTGPDSSSGAAAALSEAHLRGGAKALALGLPGRGPGSGGLPHH